MAISRSFIPGCSSLVLLAATLFVASANAATLGETNKSKWQKAAITQPRAKDGLPDGHIAKKAGGDITAAWYSDPTTRYRHGVIGDAVEAGQLNVRTKTGKTFTLKLPKSEVFEDRTPRLADLDGDGRTEVITIRSSNRGGGSVTLYALRDGQLQEVGNTGFIGRANRWLNIAGIADYLGKGTLQVAYVETPHIGGTLRLYEFRNGKMRQVASDYGYSNHAIGSRNLGLSATADMNGDGTLDLLVPNTSRSALHAVSFTGGTIRQLGKFQLPAPLETDIHTSGSKSSPTFLFGLTNGRYYQLSMPKGPDPRPQPVR